MSLQYQIQDLKIVDYELWQLGDFPNLLRGPSLKSKNNFVSYLGAAQTFGTMCRYPFPNLLSSLLAIETLNLGYGGAGPSYYLKNSFLLKYVNSGKCAVVQVMSGRSTSNSLMENPSGTSMLKYSNGRQSSMPKQAHLIWEEFFSQSSEQEIKALVHETRQNWVNEYKELVSLIKVPTVLLYISKRMPDFSDDTSKVQTLFRSMPHMINRECMNKIEPFFDEVVYAVEKDYSESQFLDRFSGEHTAIERGGTYKRTNDYYTSQYLHITAAKELLPAISKMLKS